ncbi:MAG TPA: hypothetical protein DEQ61_16805 [Streptomyces sp.]|nr:hypothetical protein [Streptomyces sp.]
MLGTCRRLLRTLGFRCNNTAYRPVMDAIKLLEKYAEDDSWTGCLNVSVPRSVVPRSWCRQVSE